MPRDKQGSRRAGGAVTPSQKRGSVRDEVGNMDGSLSTTRNAAPLLTGSSVSPTKTRKLQDPARSICQLTTTKSKLTRNDERELLKRAYMLNSNPSGVEIRHLSQIIGRSYAGIRAWFESHKPVDTHDAVDRELQTALDIFDYLDTSCSDGETDDDDETDTDTEDELVTPGNSRVPLPSASKAASTKSTTVKHFFATDDGPIASMPTNLKATGASVLRPSRTSSSRSLIDGDKKAALEAYFEKNPNPSMDVRKVLATKIHIDSHRISQWFAMRRFRLRRVSQESGKSIDPIDNNDMDDNDNQEDNQTAEPIPASRKPDKQIGPPPAPPPMSLRSRGRMEPEPSSSCSVEETRPVKKTRFLPPDPVKHKAPRFSRPPRVFFPAVDWSAPIAPSDATPRITFWYARKDEDNPVQSVVVDADPKLAYPERRSNSTAEKATRALTAVSMQLCPSVDFEVPSSQSVSIHTVLPFASNQPVEASAYTARVSLSTASDERIANNSTPHAIPRTNQDQDQNALELSTNTAHVSASRLDHASVTTSSHADLMSLVPFSSSLPRLPHPLSSAYIRQVNYPMVSTMVDYRSSTYGSAPHSYAPSSNSISNFYLYAHHATNRSIHHHSGTPQQDAPSSNPVAPNWTGYWSPPPNSTTFPTASTSGPTISLSSSMGIRAQTQVDISPARTLHNSLVNTAIPKLDAIADFTRRQQKKATNETQSRA